MKKILITLFVSFSVSVFAATDTLDVIHLSNGVVVRGKIIDKQENTSLKIKTTKGENLIFSVSDIEKIYKEEISASDTVIDLTYTNQHFNKRQPIEQQVSMISLTQLGANSAFSQKKEIFNKKMYLGINGAYHFYRILDYCDNFDVFSINLEFERQFSEHWGYTAGLGIFHWLEKTYSDDRWAADYYYLDIYLEMPIGMKFYSKIINLSMGITAQMLLHRFEFYIGYNIPEPSSNWIFGPYLTISKDFTVFKNFKMEPYIQGYMIYYIVPFPSVGLRIKYGF